MEQIRRYSRSNSKVVKNRAEFWSFFSPSQILGGRPSESYTNVMTPASRHVVWNMSCGDTPTSPEVIVASTLYFKPNFKFSRLKFFGGPSSPFRRYSRSKQKVVKNRAEFWTFFSPSQILGGRPTKSYTHFITPVSRHVPWKKFCRDTPTSLEVIGSHTLNFKPNFKFSRLNFFRGSPFAVVVCGTHFIAPASRHVPWKKFCEDTPTSLEVIGAHTLNFKVNFKFSGLKFFGGTPSQFGCALAGFGQSVARLKISGRSTP